MNKRNKKKKTAVEISPEERPIDPEYGGGGSAPPGPFRSGCSGLFLQCAAELFVPNEQVQGSAGGQRGVSAASQQV